jgi:hypothetical protein
MAVDLPTPSPDIGDPQVFSHRQIAYRIGRWLDPAHLPDSVTRWCWNTAHGTRAFAPEMEAL